MAINGIIKGTRGILRGLWGFFTGVVVSVIAFAANFTDFKQPDVTVEITSVTTTSSKPLDLARIPELSDLAVVLGIDSSRSFFFIKQDNGIAVEEIQRQMQIRKSSFAATLAEMDRVERQVNSAVDSGTDKENVLSNAIRRYSDMDFTPFPGEGDKTQELLEIFRKTMKDNREKVAESIARFEKAEKQWAVYQDTTLPDLARLEVTAAIGNRGSGATSLKPQGLLRANLGDGNYLDVTMKLSGYEKSADMAELQSKTFKVVRFQSEELQSMNPADRQRFKTFLGNVSPATIYVADVRGKAYFSNSVPFSPGVYEQKVYDSLKQFATEVSRK
ncbi:hypothetical protein [Pseudomonas sp. SBB6]|uniref:hypothetical protein n=1 Tax=Pseudomonas sp. SBB6 TaxID=2962032 RepID=UPI0020B8FDB3|nr:hypothetical protein [Pseudomonas sp. SBB6]MCP3751623.1 hypothetical protein [Pseudomonas sp. SBB6]